MDKVHPATSSRGQITILSLASLVLGAIGLAILWAFLGKAFFLAVCSVPIAMAAIILGSIGRRKAKVPSIIGMTLGGITLLHLLVFIIAVLLSR